MSEQAEKETLLKKIADKIVGILESENCTLYDTRKIFTMIFKRIEHAPVKKDM